jgi:hypothetical protein
MPRPERHFAARILAVALRQTAQPDAFIDRAGRP